MGQTRIVFVIKSLWVWFAKTIADFEIDDIAALPPLLCYNSYLCFDSSACASERWFASCARVGASYSRISRYANNSPLSFAKTLRVTELHVLTMLQRCSQAVDLKVDRHFGPGQGKTDSHRRPSLHD